MTETNITYAVFPVQETGSDSHGEWGNHGEHHLTANHSAA